MSDKEDLKRVNKSGFPFQLRVDREIRRTVTQHGWELESMEHPWAHLETGESGFIDLIYTHTRYSTYRLVVECKRVKADDARQLKWLFLQEKDDNAETTDASCLFMEGDSQSDPPGWKFLWDWVYASVTPQSPESQFCVLPSDEGRNLPLLESLAVGLLKSMEGLAGEEIRIAESRQDKSGRRKRYILPLIVTNAKIVVCKFDPARVSLEDGTLGDADVELREVPFIRFRKSLATKFPTGEIPSLERANLARQRTVFVANAETLPEFLKELRVYLPDQW